MLVYAQNIFQLCKNLPKPVTFNLTKTVIALDTSLVPASRGN